MTGPEPAAETPAEAIARFGAAMAEVGAALIRAWTGALTPHGPRAETGDPTGDPPIGGPE